MPTVDSPEIPPVRISVRLKLMVFAALVALLAGGGPATWLILKGRAQERARIRAQLKQLGSTIAGGGLFAAGTGGIDARALKSFVDNAPNLRLPLAYVLLVKPDGNPDPARSAVSATVLREIDPLLSDLWGAGGEDRVLAALSEEGKVGASHQSLWVNLKGAEGEGLGRLRIGMSTAEADRRARSALLAGAGMVAGIIAAALFVAFLISGALVRPLRRLSDAMQRVAAGDLETDSPEVKSRDEIGQVSAAFGHMTAGLRQREEIRAAMGRYVSDEIAEKIISEAGGELSFEGRIRQITVLFLDMRNFSGMSERQNPRAVFEMLNGYFGIIVDAVSQNDGVINKFIGDAVMAVWGAPTDVEDPEFKAIRAGWDIQQKVATFNRQRELAGEIVVDIGIGINAGPAAAGNVGAASRMEYTVIGHTVNMAQRFESAAGAGQVLVSPEVFAAVEGRIDGNPLPPVKVKGRTDPVQLYEITGFFE